jgi:hypothetical protein
VDHGDIVLAGERRELLEERQLHAGGRGIVREAGENQARSRPRALERPLEVGEELPVRPERNGADVGAGERGRERVDRVGGFGDQARVAGADEGPRDVADRLLRPHRRDHLGLWIERDAVPALVPISDRPAEVREASAGRIAVVPRVARRLRELVDDRLGRGQVGIPHAEVHNVLARAARGRLQVVDDVEDVRGQPVDPPELLQPDLPSTPRRGGARCPRSGACGWRPRPPRHKSSGSDSR